LEGRPPLQTSQNQSRTSGPAEELKTRTIDDFTFSGANLHETLAGHSLLHVEVRWILDDIAPRASAQNSGKPLDSVDPPLIHSAKSIVTKVWFASIGLPPVPAGVQRSSPLQMKPNFGVQPPHRQKPALIRTRLVASMKHSR
jgi:hypothetical protein